MRSYQLVFELVYCKQMRIVVSFALFVYCVAAAEARLLPAAAGEQCGFVNASGDMAIPAQFLDCGDFSEGLAPVRAGERWGYVNEKGAIEIQPRFIAADGFSDGLAFVTVSAGSKVVIDRQGKVLFEADYYAHHRFTEGLAAVHPVHKWSCPGTLEWKESCPDGRGSPRDPLWAYIDASGRMAIPPRFFFAGEFHDGLAFSDRGFIDRTGNVAIPGPFSNAKPFVNGVAPVQVENKEWGYIDKRGGWLSPPSFTEAGSIIEGRGLVKAGGKYGYVNASGTLVIAARFDNALPFSSALAAVRLDGKWGYIDASGNTAVPFLFDAARSFEGGFASVVRESRAAVIDQRGMVVKAKPVTLAQTFQRLQSFAIDPETQLPPLDQIIPILSVYKEQLRQLAVEVLKESDDPAAAKAALETKLRRAGIIPSKDQERRPYGLLESLEVIQDQRQPNLLSVLFHLKLASATDTSYSLFHRARAGWDLALELDRNDYMTGELDAYHLSPPQFTASDANGSFLMLLAYDSGRYGNGSYNLWADLYRLDAAFNKQELFHQRYGAKAHQFALDAAGFRVETIGMEHDAVRAGYRVFPFRYEIRGANVTRVAPIGFDAHDFVGEWGNLPWEEAKKWSDPANLEKIQRYYNKVRQADGFFGGEFERVQFCDPQQRMWQIEFKDSAIQDAVYFLVERAAKWTFFVKDIGETMRKGCQDVDSDRGVAFQTMFSKPLEW